MKRNTPVGINIIGWYQILSAVVILLTLNIQQNPPFNIRFAVPFISEPLVKILVSIFAITIAYGYLRQTKWGYWSMLTYSILFCCISIFQESIYGGQPFVRNATFAFIVTIYTVLRSKYFIKNDKFIEQS